MLLLQDRHEFHAIHERHPYVREHNVNLMLRDELQGIESMCGAPCYLDVQGLPGYVHYSFAYFSVIIDDQKRIHWGSPGLEKFSSRSLSISFLNLPGEVNGV